MNSTAMISFLNRLANPALKLLLRSPLHRLVSRGTMLISYTGRKSGRRYTTPVNYLRDGDTILVVSQAARTWWRNLRGGAPVTLLIAGSELRGIAECYEDPQRVAAGLLVLLRQLPAFRKYANIALTADGQPVRSGDLAQLAQGKVIVRIVEPVAAAPSVGGM
jgi:hypothetical protein